MLAQMTNGGGPKIIRSNRGSECDELGKSLPVRIPQRWTLAMKSDDEEDIHVSTNSSQNHSFTLEVIVDEFKVGRGSERKPLGLLSGHNNVIQLSQVENVEPQQRAYNNWEEKLNDHQPDSIDMGMEGEMFGQMEGIPQDITAESFQVLARSLHPADDPERLFGDRPNRRRYRTGEVMRAQPLRDF